MDQKRILIHGINYHPEITGIGKYTHEMVEWLAKDHQCTVVTSFPYYPYWKVQPPYKNLFFKRERTASNVVIYRCPLYVPAKPSGGKRIIHDATFFLSSFFMFIKLMFHKKYDLVISVAPPFHLGLLAIMYRFIKGAKIAYHIQDLQVDAARELQLIKSPALLSALERLEKYILKKVNYISTLSTGMSAKIKAKVNRPVILFANWVEVDQYYPIENSASLKAEWNLKPVDIIILYSGNIGEKQGLDIIIEVAKHFENEKQIKFVICGTGAYKEKLVEKVLNDKLSNIIFLPLQPKSAFNRFLNMADIHLVLQKRDATDLVMPSKLTAILAVGGFCIVSAVPGSSLFHQVSDNNLGVVIEPEDTNALANAIEAYTNNPMQANAYKMGARKFSILNLGIENIMQSFSKKVLSDL